MHRGSVYATKVLEMSNERWVTLPKLKKVNIWNEKFLRVFELFSRKVSNSMKLTGQQRDIECALKTTLSKFLNMHLQYANYWNANLFTEILEKMDQKCNRKRLYKNKPNPAGNLNTDWKHRLSTLSRRMSSDY